MTELLALCLKNEEDTKEFLFLTVAEIMNTFNNLFFLKLIFDKKKHTFTAAFVNNTNIEDLQLSLNFFTWRLLIIDLLSALSTTIKFHVLIFISFNCS